MGAVYDSGDYEKALDLALKAANWNGLKAERDAARKEGRLVGLGLAMYVEVCGIGPSSSLPDRRLGAFAGHHRTRRPDQRHHRRLTARAGQRDDVRADARRSVRRAASSTSRSMHGDTGDREAGNRHVRQPLAGGRRHRAAHGGRQGEDEDGEVRCGAARGARGGPRLRERHDWREGIAGVRASRSPRSPASPTSRCRCPEGLEPGLERRSVLRTDEQHLSVRLPHLDARDRSRHGRAEAAQAGGRRRRRKPDQSADRRRTDSRRAGAGHRPGDGRGGRLQRATVSC